MKLYREGLFLMKLNFLIVFFISSFSFNIEAKSAQKSKNADSAKSGKKMSEKQKKFSDMKNHESRMNKYKNELDHLSELRKQALSKEERKKIAKKYTDVLKKWRKEEKIYRMLKNELRYKFPEHKDESFSFFHDASKGVNDVELLQDEDMLYEKEMGMDFEKDNSSKEKYNKVLKTHETHEHARGSFKDSLEKESEDKKMNALQKKNQKINTLLSSFHAQMERTYGLLKNKKFKNLRQMASLKAKEVHEKSKNQEEKEKKREHLDQSKNGNGNGTSLKQGKSKTDKNFQGFKRIIFEK